MARRQRLDIGRDVNYSRAPTGSDYSEQRVNTGRDSRDSRDPPVVYSSNSDFRSQIVNELTASLNTTNYEEIVIQSSVDTRAVIIAINKKDQKLPLGYTKFASGLLKITLLKGCGTLNGYALSCHEPLTMMSPIWGPSAKLEIEAKQHIDTTKSYDYLVSKFHELFEGENFILQDQYNCLLFLEGYSRDEQEWLYTLEDQSLYQSLYSNNLNNVTSIKSGVLGDRAELEQQGLECIQYHRSWIDATKSIRSCVSNRQQPRVVMCGAKGSGKSTFLRYTLNSLLHNSKRKSNGHVCIIDCDVGQPEIGPPGMISLSFVNTPLLSPPHLHHLQSYVSYYIGDVTTKNEPKLFTAYFQELYNIYLAVLETYRHNGLIPVYEALLKKDVSKAKSHSSSSNLYSLLLPEEERNLTNDSYMLPLLINCDGNVRYIGAELLVTILSTAKPSHIIYLSKTSEIFTPIEVYRQQDPGVEVIKVDQGRVVPSKIASVDLRILRLISYFLRKSDYLHHITHDAATSDSSESLYIRNGTIVDSYGHISIAMMKSIYFYAPFNKVSICVNNNSPGLAPRLILAAINATIVGVTAHSSSIRDSSVALVCPSNPSKTFSVAYNTINVDDLHITPCLGLGIIRAVDTNNENLLVIPPSGGTLVDDSHSKLCVIRSNIAMPNMFIYGSHLPFYPYMSSESTGEGSTEMKSRTNVKRRRDNL